MVEAGPDHWKVRYLRTLREYFHVYVDREGTLRTDHLVRFLGLTVLRLHYKMERTRPSLETPRTVPRGQETVSDVYSEG
jgi:hypothetical protein